MELEQSGLQEVANAIREEITATGEFVSNSTQKRKRDASDQDGSADDTRRAINKRVSPNNVVANEAGDQSADNQQEGNTAIEALQDYSTLHQQRNSGNQNGSVEHANASSTAAAALAGIYPTMTIPQPTDVSFATQASEGDRNPDSSFNMGDSQQGGDSFMENSTQGNQLSGSRGSGSKPTVGSDEWHKIRKDNHKEVERRRRETINEGINELAKIVPGCEKNKGSILQRAVSFITQLKENEAQNIEKWTLEKLLTEQAIAELSASNDKLKTECERAWREVETWKKTCQSAGLAPKKEDAPATTAGES
jgi:bHLH factor